MFSKDILVSQLNTLLTYTERFYQHQFQQRMENHDSSLKQHFLVTLKNTPADHIPTVENIAKQLHVTPRCLSDA